MAPLLPSGGLYPTRARWAAILAAATALAAVAVDWPATWDTARGLVPAANEQYGWDAADLADSPGSPEGLTAGFDDADAAQSARLTAADLVLELAWEPELDIESVKVETYEDAYGTGLRLGVAADTTTASGPDCLNAHATAAGRTTDLQWCVHTVQHGPVDMDGFLGKGDGDAWEADRLFVTQTANLDAGSALVDYYGLGAATGDAYETGLWPVGIWTGGEHPADCDDPDLRLRIDDLHLTDRYADPAEHRQRLDEVRDAHPAFPAEGRLLSPACADISGFGPFGSIAVKPFRATGSVPFSGVAPYNATTRDVLPVRAAVVVDVRSCDAGIADCTADAGRETWWAANGGPGGEQMAALLDR
ncbi:hypothetical protein [Glycomyces sp. MUSA5-2]|uniref:hypothetical protein n=1 Tax=Glycomyces sp. MUSA5-2 TaxID=2053002 RepID=UPI003008C5E8